MSGNQGDHARRLGEQESRPFIKKAPELGIDLFDTANPAAPREPAFRTRSLVFSDNSQGGS